MTDPSNAPLLLIADDESDITDMLKSYFEMKGYLVVTAKDGTGVLQVLKKKQPDLILLDINMPGMDGYETCEAIRTTVSCPILFLTARVEDADKIDGFAVGADDYIVKPFSLDVLNARISAHLARDQRKQNQSIIRLDEEIAIDFATHQLFVYGNPVKLPRKEYKICALLIKNSSQVFDRDQIYEKVWHEAYGDSSVVTEHIRRLRKALHDAGAINEHIITVWGIGYRWC